MEDNKMKKNPDFLFCKEMKMKIRVLILCQISKY